MTPLAQAQHAEPAATAPAPHATAQQPAQPATPSSTPSTSTPASTDPHAAAPTPAAGDASAPQTPPAPVEGHGQPASPAHGESAQPAHGPASQGAGTQGADAHGATTGEHGGEEHHEEGWLPIIARLTNFLLLAGGLWYVLRKPLGDYLASRSQQIRGDLETAKATTATATQQLADIEQRLKALPAELEQLKKRGHDEVVAEEARIRQMADTERQRLLEQTRREIDLQVRLAKRDLTEHAATLAVEHATRRVQATITPEDQARLVDRYVSQVRNLHD